MSKSEESTVDFYNQKFNEYQRLNIDTAKLYIDSILIISKKINYTKGIGIATLNQGLLENIKGNYLTARNNNEKAINIFTALKNDSLLAKANSALGVNHWQLGEYDKALQCHFKALKINEQLKLKNEIAANYNHISMVYQSQDKLTLAEEFANKSMQIVSKLSPNYNNISVFHNLANIKGMQGKYKEALALDSIGLKWCEQLNVEFNKSMFYDNIANCFYYSGNIPMSIQYHLKAISIDSTFKNNKQLGDTYCSLGIIYEKLGDYTKAIHYFKMSLDFCKETGYKIGVKNVYENLSDLYFKMNKPADAYFYLKQSVAVKDSILNAATEQKIAELQTLFDTEKKKQEITRQSLIISRRNILLSALIFIFISATISFALFYNRKKSEQERKLQEELLKEEEKRTDAILKSEENERQRLARELHDGVGQLLTATRLNLSTLDNLSSTEENNKLKNSLNILDDSIKEIRNISHNMVPDILLKSGLKNALIDFIARINQTGKIRIAFECISFDENSMDDTSKLMLYRIIQETVNNALKYAEADHLNITLTADEQEISLLMEDNGKGFDVKEALAKGGIGLKNIQLRTKYLKGKLEVDSSIAKGTTIIVEIPLT